MRRLGLLLLIFMVQVPEFGRGDEPRPVADRIEITVVGTLRTGIVAIGGETTGTTITAKGITWELDFGKDASQLDRIAGYNGKKVRVDGTLSRRDGVEIKERWIVDVEEFRPAAGVPDNRPD